MWLPKKLLKKCINQNVKSSLESRKSWNYTYSFCSPCLRNIAFLKCWDAAVPSPAKQQRASTSPCPSTSVQNTASQLFETEVHLVGTTGYYISKKA